MTEHAVDTGVADQAGKAQFVFRRCLPLQVLLGEVLRSLDDTEGLVCLDVGMPNPMVSHYLRKRGGEWHSAVRSQDAVPALQAVVEDNVHVIEDRRLPFENKSFDVAVIADTLERYPNDQAFIEECHRVLRPDGRLVLNVPRLKSGTLLTPLRRLLRLDNEKRGLARVGYTEPQLFNILKDGFDVHRVRSYSRFFVQLVDLWVTLALFRVSEGSPDREKRLARIYAVAGVFYRIALQVDTLLIGSRGHMMIAVAKRRAWRPRKAPILVDGRSISEAVLSKAGN